MSKILDDRMPKVGDKYIIEIQQIYAANTRRGTNDITLPVNLYRIKGFNSLVFDNIGLSKLEKFDEKIFFKNDEPISVGDEVETNSGDRGVVVNIGFGSYLDTPVVMSENGSCYGYLPKEAWHKTGRRFPEIQQFLNKIKEDRNG